MNALPKTMSLDDFLAWEERQELRFEYDGFHTKAMTGGTSAHALIQANLIGELHARLRGSPCRAFGSELKVRMQSSIRYPDALVVCGKLDPNATFTEDATVVFEILSKRSAVDDFGVKSVEYRTLPSLKRYVVLHQSVAAGEVFHLDAEGSWSYDFLNAAGALDMPELKARIPLSELYAGVDLAA